MSTTSQWPSAMTHVATHLYRSFGYTSAHDRADALHSAILRLLSLQRQSGLHMQDDEMRRWLHCVASRMLLDARRMHMRVTTFSDLVHHAEDDHYDSGAHEHLMEMSYVPVQGIDISYALQRLTPSLRTCFELHSQGFHAEEIAETLGLTRDAVHKRIQRARRELQANLKAYL